MRIDRKDVSERSHSKIIKRYVKSPQFFVDFLATFPFYLIQTDEMSSTYAVVFKLLRMVRLPKIVSLLDETRFDKLNDWIATGQTRGRKVEYQIATKNIFKVLRLIMMTIIITYFLGCAFYFCSSLQNPDEPSFLKNNDLLDDTYKDFYKFITVCYFSITTLSTVGYGDLSPVTNVEKVIGIFIMLAGVGFFSFVMSSFIEIISNLNAQNLGIQEETFELHNWMTLLSRFRQNQPLPNSLYRQINQHFKHYWQNNRIHQVGKDNEFINSLPGVIKRGIIVHYLFDDIFYNFRIFFNPQKYKESKFLYDVAYGLMPRNFSCKPEENVIYDEEEEVLEMYFITAGTVGVGYHLYQQPLETSRY